MTRDLSPILAKFDVQIESLHTNHLRLDSRAVEQGDVFIALKGHVANGEDFIASAIAQGAAAVLIEAAHVAQHIEHAGNIIGVPNLAQQTPFLAAEYYGQPSKALSVIGVTGTNGKSTTTAMIAALANACDHNGAVVGTLGYGHPDTLTPLNNTTPANIDLQRILAELKAANNDLVAMEVSSHGLVQNRVTGTSFKAAVFTNLSRDHLDYHGDMQNYGDAKLKLFTDCEPEHCILNVDDACAQAWLEQHTFNNLVAYGQQPKAHTYRQYVWFSELEYHQQGISALLTTSWGDAKISAPLFGEFNIYNLAAAIATLMTQGYDFEQVCAGAENIVPVAGRMQAFSAPNKPICVVDYAHTPDALALALQALQHHVPGKVTCVFGCGGDRDKGKRPLMAQAAEQNADRLVITSDNPRSEDPLEIINDVKAGLSQPEYAYCDIDRASAIKHAINSSDDDSVVLIAGKGHEDYQIIGETRLSFCDRSWVQAILQGEKA